MSYLTESLAHKERTPQTEPIPGSSQVPNHALGYAWAVDDWTFLDRFLILGSEAGTYYVGERDLTKQHLEGVKRLVKQDGLRAVLRVTDVSQQALAPKNDPALLVLALASVEGDERTRAAALRALPLVARTATHLFDFLTFRQKLGGGWGRGTRRAVSQWYLSKDPDQLAYQLVKYRSRNGWTHRDVLRKAHPVGEGAAISGLLSYAALGMTGHALSMHETPGSLYPHPLVQGYELASRSPSAMVTAGLVHEYGLPREAVPTEHLRDKRVWQALLENQGRGMPYLALLRNLAVLTRLGVLEPLSGLTARVAEQLARPEIIQRSRVHPVQILAALTTYASGRGVRGSGTWTPLKEVIDALDAAFYVSFGNVPATGRAVLLGLDVSGSMAGTVVNGVPGLSCRSAAGAMALITAATEMRNGFVGFDTQSYPLPISPRQRLDDVVRLLERTGGGGTDCALPIRFALQEKLPVDAFVIYTDSETWAGREHPAQAIRRYRERTGIDARLVVVAMASTSTSVADPTDAGQLDVVGFDPTVPQVISQFLAG